ncbi:MAG: tetratricopeptide repeat protein [Nitrospinae bacterium]|nr:tetratricopeptide repeat protein [Nitrospinota bacterium]MBI3814765.1 tetratricopeptide repeat protein [Nitrospinota bacterium]
MSQEKEIKSKKVKKDALGMGLDAILKSTLPPSYRREEEKQRDTVQIEPLRQIYDKELTINNIIARRKGDLIELSMKLTEKGGSIVSILSEALDSAKKGNFDSLMNKDETNREAALCNERGLALFKNKKYIEAIEEFKRGIALNNSMAELHYHLAFVYDEIEDYKSAITEYSAAANLKSDDAEIRNNLAIAYYNDNRIEEALKELNDALRINPDYKLAKENLLLMKGS